MPGYLKEVNIKSDLPTSSEAVKRVTYNIRNGKAWGCGAVKIIHGYGSSGKGGKIRTEVRRYLAEQKQKGLITDLIPGEEFSIFGKATLDAFGFCDELRRDKDLERSNNGVTIVVL
ncbi:MAG: Smr/MutS family protein [Oscillospiraceae bacterium]|nr:Smr/MutS family protein [Oscillospiraceae bacterium]